MYKFKLKIHGRENKNVLNPDKVVQGQRVNEDGVTIPAPDFAFTEFINVEPFQDYNFTTSVVNSIVSVSFYDLNKNFVSQIYGFEILSFVAPEYITFCIVTIQGSATLDPSTVGLMSGLFTAFTPFFTSREVLPVYKQLTRTNERQSGAWYFREKLEGGLKLVRDDFDFLAALDFEQEIILNIEDPSGFFETFVGVFYKADCKMDFDNRLAEVKVETLDGYGEILAGLDKTYNLIDLMPEIEEITLRRRPLLQVYIPGDKVVTNILGGSTWEQELQGEPEFDHDNLTNYYHFNHVKNILTVPVSYAAQLSTNVTGEYGPDRVSVNGFYRVDTEYLQNFPGMKRVRYKLVRVSDGAVLYRTLPSKINFFNINFLEFFAQGSQTGKFFFTEYRVYVRRYSDEHIVDGVPTFPITEADIVANNSNYKRIIGSNVNDFYIWDQVQPVPSKFGRVPEGSPDAGKYYKERNVDPSTGLSGPIPVSASAWRGVSLWFYNSEPVRLDSFRGGSEFNLREAFPLVSVIKSLLRAIGSPIVFEPTDAHSVFLFGGSNPLGGFQFLDFDPSASPLDYQGNLSYFLTPKSNLMVSDTGQAAKKAETGLGQIFAMLRDVFKCFWHVKDGRLVIEHVTFYQRGGTYDAEPLIGTDLTEIVQLKNGKNWIFGQNKFEYDKNDMPERYEFGWMDDVSKPFDGEAIEILSKYVQLGKVEPMAVNNVTTDVDFIMANAASVSRDGFALIGTVKRDNKNRVPFIEVQTGVNSFAVLQNGILGFSYLLPKFHVYNLPADDVIINGKAVHLLNNNSQHRKQEAEFPAPTLYDPYKLIKTSIGSGLVQKMAVSMGSRFAKATIKYDTEKTAI